MENFRTRVNNHLRFRDSNTPVDIFRLDVNATGEEQAYLGHWLKYSLTRNLKEFELRLKL